MYSCNGVPNNDVKQVYIVGGKSHLIGNLYSSAINGDAFIRVNSIGLSASLSMTLYFGRMELRYKQEAILRL